MPDLEQSGRPPGWSSRPPGWSDAPPDNTSQGALSSFGEASGLSGLKDLVTHPINTLAKIPAGLVDEGGRVASQLKEAWNTPNNEPMKAIDRTLYATPFFGSSLKKADEQAASGNIKGAVGTGLGTLGGIVAAGTGSGLAKEAIPSTAKAAGVFDMLNTELADHPVPLKATLKPLQRAAEVAARGGTLPKPLSDLLTRSQAIEPMTFPEIRDYQGALSDLSPADKMGMSGRMRGALSQVSKSLFSDIQDAAEEKGLGSDYADAMKEFRQGSRIKDTAKTAGKMAVKGAAGAVGLGTGYGLLKNITGN